MNIEKLGLKYFIVVLIIAWALWSLWPPQQRLKPGIDLAGGTSLLYEIDTTDLDDEQIPQIADRLIGQLRKRVDPDNQRNLVWRKVGRTRIEIQMPGTTGESKQLRQSKNEAVQAVVAMNINRGEVQAAVQLPEDSRQAALEGLVSNLRNHQAELQQAGSTEAKQAAARLGALADERLRLLTELAENYATYTQDQTTEALQAYENKLDELLATNIDSARLQDVLALEKTRDAQLDILRVEHPAFAHDIDATIASYDAWAKTRGLIDDPEDLKRLLRGAGVLEFRIVAERDPANPSRLDSRMPELAAVVDDYLTQLEDRGPRRKQGMPYQWFKVEDIRDFLNLDDDANVELAVQGQNRYVIGKYADEYYVLAYDMPTSDPRCFTLLKGGDDDEVRTWKLKRAFAGRDFNTGRLVVYFNLDARGGELFGKLTGNNIGKPLGIFLDSVCMSAPNIQSQIYNRGQITGNFSAQELDFLTKTLEAGSLPARLKEPPLSERSVGSSIGEANLNQGITAAIVGLALVGVFMLIYYLLAGVIANVALIMNVLLILAFMATLEATFTLPGIAALILTFGMAVDANVLIFERIREELRRGSSLKMAVKNGYEKAFSTIFDANVTTLITSVILYYAGSEEVKGFAIVLGLGVVFSMFTALWVTRWIFAGLVQSGMLKSLHMMRIIGVPNVRWMDLRTKFWPISVVVVLCGGGLFLYEHSANKANIYDIEFLGGTAVTVDFKQGVQMSEERVRETVTGEGQDSAAGWLEYFADAVPGLTVRVGNQANSFIVSSPEFSAPQLEMAVMAQMADDIEPTARIRQVDPRTIQVVTRSEREYGLDTFQTRLEDCSLYLRRAAQHLRTARVQVVKESAQTFDINTTETNQDVLRQAIVQVMQDSLRVQMPISYTILKDDVRAPEGYYAVTSGETTTATLRLKDVIGGDSLADVNRFRGGVAMVFEDLTPADSEASIRERLAGAGLLPEFAQFEYRQFEIVPLTTLPADDALPLDQRRLSSFALLVADENVIYDDAPEIWEAELASPELDKAEAALGSRKTLQKVNQFAPQIAAVHTMRAIMAILLALIMIVIYITIRFGDMRFGLAAIVALVHDVSISLGAVAASYYIADKLGGANFLLIRDFKIDLSMIGAFLTIVGYSLNDTIVVFDRIRENRGKMKQIDDRIVNASINQTLSRTLLTSTTTLVAVLVMYIFGGPGIRGFSFAMMVGVVVGTYSSVAIATPLVLHPRVLKWLIYVLIAAVLLGLGQITPQRELQTLVWIVLGLFVAYVGFSEIRGGAATPGRLAGA